MSELTSLYNHYQLPLTRLCLRKGVNSNDAHDIVQETFITFMEVRKNFQGRSKISTFLYGICFNKIREHFTRNTRGVNLYKKIVEDKEAIMDLHGDRYKENSTDPEKLYEVSQEISLIESLLKKLGQRDRDIIISNCILGETSKEIATSMNINDNHARQLISRAKKRIKNSREEYLQYA